MTRREALREAAQIVAKARIGRGRKEEILAGLALCQEELPFARWTEAAVFDACDAWVEEHGALTLRAFSASGMPSGSVVKGRFGLTARAFRDCYYPLPGVSRSRYNGQDVEEWNRRFQEEFDRLRCTGQADYNRRRDREMPTWNTLAAMNGLRTWRALLVRTERIPYPKDRPAAEVRILKEKS